MKKKPSKRRTWARFQQGKWVRMDDMLRFNLQLRGDSIHFEYSEFKQCIRRIP